MPEDDTGRGKIELCVTTYVEAQIEQLRGLLDQRMDAAEKALQLQAIVYEQRLAILNESHKRADEVAKTIVGRDVYAAHCSAVDQKIEALAERFAVKVDGLTREVDRATTSNMRLWMLVSLLLVMMTGSVLATLAHVFK